MTLKAHADSIAAKVGIDPVLVLTLLSAILPVLIECLKTPEEAAEYFRQDTKATRRRIRIECNRSWRAKHKVDAPKKLVIEVQHRLAMATAATMKALYVSHQNL